MVYDEGDPNFRKRMMQNAEYDNYGYLEKWKWIGVVLIAAGVGLFFFSPVIFGMMDASEGRGEYTLCCTPLAMLFGVGFFIYGIYVLAFKLKTCTHYSLTIPGRLTGDSLVDMDRYFGNRKYYKADAEGAVYFYRTYEGSATIGGYDTRDVRLVFKLVPDAYLEQYTMQVYAYAKGRLFDPTDKNNYHSVPSLRHRYPEIVEFTTHFRLPFNPTNPPVIQRPFTAGLSAGAGPGSSYSVTKKTTSSSEGVKKTTVTKTYYPPGPGAVNRLRYTRPFPSKKEKASTKPPPIPEGLDKQGDLVPCIHCAMPIDFTATDCPHCGNSIV